MYTLFDVQTVFMLVVNVALFVFQVWAFVDAVSRRPQLFVAADKLTKPAWLIILGLALAAHLLIRTPVHILNLIGIVAAIVYIVDARPAMKALTRR